MKGAIPFPAPADSDEVNTIKTFVDYIVRNGDAFENKVKEKESGNPKFNFLYPDQNSHGYKYYRWILFCSQHFYTEQQVALIESTFKLRIEQAAPGSIELSNEDHDYLISLINQNNGTKESIKKIRKWLVDYGHSLSSSVHTICNSLHQNIDLKFPQYLSVIYVANDLLYNGSGITTKGPYTQILDSEPVQVSIFKILLPYLPWLLQRSFRLAEADNERERILKMIPLWNSKGFIDDFLSEHLNRLILQSELIPFPPPAVLISPYPQGLPPPNFPAPSTQLGFGPGPVVENHMDRANVPSFPVPPPFSIPLFRPPYPTSASLPLQQPWLDLQSCSVGSMANIVKSTLKSGYPRYAPMDINSISRATPQAVEPGRLEARISEFYKKYESISQ